MEREQIIKGIIVLLFLGLVPFNISAQELIFEKRPDNAMVHPNFGPNRKHFAHPFISASIKTDPSLAGQIALGIRYKLKVSRPFSLVSEIGLQGNFFNLNPKNGIFPTDSAAHLSQSIKTSGFFGGAFIRTRLGQRGDYLGNFIDLGISFESYLLNKLITRDENNSGGAGSVISEKTSKTIFRKLNPLSYSALIRIGFDKFSMVVSYRLSRLLNSTIKNDLPALQVGLEFSPFRY